jgi:hypothetical protein
MLNYIGDHVTYLVKLKEQNKKIQYKYNRMHLVPAELFGQQTDNNDQQRRNINIRSHQETKYSGAFREAAERFGVVGALYDKAKQEAEIANKCKL